MVLRGVVQVDGVPALKPGAMISPNARLTIDESEMNYVSRGGLKLAAALDAFSFSPVDAIAIDVGASAGGFTDVLLREGAAHVYAVDVGHDQLHGSLRTNNRVTVLEDTDARQLSSQTISSPVSAIVCDTSFISLTQVLPAAMALAAPGCWLVALIKPQFELEAGEIGKGGIVKSGAHRQKAITRVTSWLDSVPGWRRTEVICSPVTGKRGNVEYLIGACFDV